MACLRKAQSLIKHKRAIELFEAGLGVGEVTARLNINRSTVANWHLIWSKEKSNVKSKNETSEN